MRLTVCRGLILSLALALGACGPDRDGDMWDVARDTAVDARADAPVSTDVPRVDTVVPPRDVVTPTDTVVPPRDVTPPPPDTSTAMCANPCSSDVQCQSTCPVEPGSIRCCFIPSGSTTGTCIAMTSPAVCPSTSMDGGTTGTDGFSFDGFSFDGFSFDGFSLDGFSFDF